MLVGGWDVRYHANMLPALLMLPLLGPIQTAKAIEKPVIVVAWHSGYSSAPLRHVLEFAAWKSGRVVWSDKPVEYASDGKSIRGKQFEASIDPTSVDRALKKIRAAKVLGLKDWNLFPPDASTRSVEVRDGAQLLKLTTWRTPDEAPPAGRDAALYAKQLRAWKLVTELVKQMRPTKGKAIAPLDLWRGG